MPLPPLEASLRLETASFFREIEKVNAALRSLSANLKRSASGGSQSGLTAIFDEVARSSKASQQAMLENGKIIAQQEKNRYAVMVADAKAAAAERLQVERQLATNLLASQREQMAEAKALARGYLAEQGAIDQQNTALLAKQTGQLEAANAAKLESDKAYFAAQQASASAWRAENVAKDRAFYAEQMTLAKQFQAEMGGAQGTGFRIRELTNAAQGIKNAAGFIDFSKIQTGIDQSTAALGKFQGQAENSARSVRNIANAAKETEGPLGRVSSFFLRIAAFTVAAGIIVRGFFAITQAIKDTISEGIRFNATLEQGKLALAGILGSTRQVVDAQGKQVEIARAFPFLLQEAEKRQKAIMLANITTLGTGEELLGVYNQVLASTRGQAEAEGDVLKAAQIILNVSKLRGLNDQQAITEARQIFELNRNIGQTVLQTLGVQFQQAKALRDSGQWLSALVDKGQIFLKLGLQLQNTWEGLTSSVQTFFSFIAGEAFSNTFNAMKNILLGMIQVLDEADRRGGLTAALDLSPAQLQDLGRAIGEMTVSFVTNLAKVTNTLIEFAQQSHLAWEQFKSDVVDAGKTLSDFTFGAGTALANFATGIPGWLSKGAAAIDKFIQEKLHPLFGAGQEAPLGALQNFTPGLTPEALAVLRNTETQAKKNEVALRSFNAAVLAGKAVGDAYAAGWHIVNAKLASTPDELKKVAQQNVYVAEAAKRAADAQAQYAEEVAKATGDAQSFLTARLQAIDAETAVEVAQAKKRGTLSRELASIQIEDQVKRQKAAIETADIIIEQEQRIAAIIQQEIDLRAQAAQSQLTAQGTILSSHVADLQQQLAIAQEHNGTIEEQIRLTRELGDAEIAQANLALQSAQAELNASQAKIEDLRAEISAHLHLIALYEAEGNLAAASKESNLLRSALDTLDETEAKLPELQAKITAAIDGIGRAGIAASNNLQQISTVTIHWGDVIRDSIRQVFDALVQGTLNLKDAFKSLGIAIIGHITDAFATVLSNKLGFDSVIKQNVGGIGGLFSNLGGSITGALGSAFGLVGIDFNSLVSNLGTGAEALLHGDFGAIFGQGGVLSSLAQNLGPVGGSLLGGLAGKGLNKLFGVGQTSQGKLGGNVGGLVGGIGGGALAGTALGGSIGALLGITSAAVLGAVLPGIGALLGVVLGGVIGDLFAHTPTKGTEIRKATTTWLKDIDVAFADSINSKNYGFKWIKDYMKDTGVEFLEGSKHFIPDNFGDLVAQGLDKQLLAAGLFSTADISKKLGKDLNQTGLTFANMIADNLGGDPKKVSEFLKSFVEKTGATFGAFIQKTSEAFNAGRIDINLFKDAIVGAGTLFADQLPENFNVVKIALKHFTEEGKFDLEGFQNELLNIVKVFTFLGPAATEALKGAGQGLKTTEIAQNFKDAVLGNIRDAVIEGFTQGFLTVALTGAAIVEPLEKISKLIEDFATGAITKEEFGAGIKEAAAAIRPEIDRLAEALGIAGGELEAILRDAGLLTDQVETLGFAFDGLGDKIHGALKNIFNPTAGVGTAEIKVGDQAFTVVIEKAKRTARQIREIIYGAIADAVETAFIDGLVQAALDSAALAEPLAKIKKLITDFVTGAISEAEFGTGLRTAFDEAEPAIRRFAKAVSVARKEWDDFKANIPELNTPMDGATDSIDKTTQAIQGLVDKIIELNAQLEAIAHKRIEISIRLLEDLAHLDLIKNTVATGAQVSALRSELLGSLGAGGLSPIATRNPGFGVANMDLSGLTDAQLQKSIDLSDQLHDAIISDYDAQKQELENALADQITAIQDQFDAARQELEDYYQEQRDTIDAQVKALEKQKDLQQKIEKARLDALQKELKIAEAFRGVAEDIQGVINHLVVGNLSTLSGGEQLGFLQRQAESLRSQISGASPEDQPNLIKKLIDVLQQELGLDIFQRPSPEYKALFESVVGELEVLKSAAEAQGSTVEDIQRSIDQTTQQMSDTMDSIDQQIQALRDRADALSKEQRAAEKDLSNQEKAAIDAAKDATQAAIRQLAVDTAAKLTELHDLEDQLLVEQARRAEQQRQDAIDKLGTLVKPEDIDILLANPLAASALTLASLKTILIDTNHLLGGTISAQQGFQGGPLEKNQLFIAHKGEYVNIGHQRDGGSSGDMVFSPTIQVTVPAGTDGQSIGRGISNAMMQEWRYGATGIEMRKYMSRRRS